MARADGKRGAPVFLAFPQPTGGKGKTPPPQTGGGGFPPPPPAPPKTAMKTPGVPPRPALSRVVPGAKTFEPTNEIPRLGRLHDLRECRPTVCADGVSLQVDADVVGAARDRRKTALDLNSARQSP